MGNLRLLAAAATAALTVGAWGGPASASTAGTAATGQIQAVSGSKIVDGETFVISDGASSPTVFEFDSTIGVTPGHVAVPFTGALTADNIKAAITTAVNGVGASLTVSASYLGTGLVGLVNDNIGSAGNLPLFESVADPGFTVSGMSGGDAAPDLAAIGGRTADEGAQLQFVISAIDLDGDALVYSATNLPAGATFDAGTRTFTWTPSFDQAGAFPNVHFTVSDGTLSDSEDVTISVTDVNRAPVLTPIGDRGVREGAQLQFAISATDLDGDALVYSATNLPAGASFDPATRTLTWTPSYRQAGTFPNVHFTVSDGALSDSGNITISVANVLQPTTTTLSVRKTARKLKVSGTVQPGQTGQETDVAIYVKRHGKFRLLSEKRLTLTPESTYHVAFQRPRDSSRCRIESHFVGSTEGLPSSAVRTVRC